VLDEITTYIQKSHEAEKEFHKHRIESFRKEHDTIQGKMDRLPDLYLAKSIPEETYINKRKSLESEMSKVKSETELHQNADGDFKNTVMTAFGLANKASELFESSKTTKKRELIAFVFSNLSLRGVELEYTLRQPFDMMVNLSTRSEWLRVVCMFRTERYEQVMNFVKYSSVVS
jgi:hypothetical protein